ncbi:hypothetical protein DHEL01_v203647 [Diaporthe helianthi]|uniref:Uncharacterized protein n=1 Tax=Diaporthe helianthi TaxID=158607 RepID=A0A2P5I636_DIAHE|nr:hypothetical protein DHEL01_v203647 [Diaporthe helianthi]
MMTGNGKNHKSGPARIQPEKQPEPEPERQPQPQKRQMLTKEQKQYVREVYKQGQAAEAEMAKRDMEDRCTRITKMLLRENRDKPVVFSSRNDYLAMDAAYRSLSNNINNIEEQTMEGYPQTDAEWVSLTTRLAVAITSFANIVDKPPKNRQGDEGNTAVKSVKSLSTVEVQLLAGKILMATLDAHVGRYNIPSWPKVWNKDWYQSFEDRFREVCNVLSHCKASVKSIMDAEFPFALRLATAPKSEFKAKMVNKELNDRRAESRYQMKKRPREDEDDHGNGDSEGEAAPQDDSGEPVSKSRKRSYIKTRNATPTLERLSSSPGPSEIPSGNYNFTQAAGGADLDLSFIEDDDANQSPSSAGATKAESSTNDSSEDRVLFDPYDDSLGPFEYLLDDNRHWYFDSDHLNLGED